ncbi:DUF3889 domain-containing protein [Bacillus sp. FJAT-47783]|uniref:DUF3889 domain-containing protein n=1 Tax=Bacillus sp. FJAT-47783 TaxID=2922712 RepID=UPI001FAB849E|nr:DUF3889 domain-containing protein [Bacillus sp. FJAT-47783]
MSKALIVSMLLTVYGVNMILSPTPIVAAAENENYTEIAKKEAKKNYPLAQILFIQKVWDKENKKQTIKHYVVTMNEQGKQYQVNVTISINNKTNKVEHIQVFKQ